MCWILAALKNFYFEKKVLRRQFYQKTELMLDLSEGALKILTYSQENLFIAGSFQLSCRSRVYSCNLIKKDSNTEALPSEFRKLFFKINKTFLQDISPKYFLTKLLPIYRLQVYWKWCLVKICVKLIHTV